MSARHSRCHRMARVPLRITCATLLLAGAVSASATDSGSAAVTTDYVWRGTSQSQGDPAVQAGFKVAGASGWYGALWAASVEFGPEARASSEFDATVGWAGALSPDWVLDLNLTRYLYPSTAVDLDWTEMIATLNWKQDGWLQVGHSRDALATGESGTYAQVGARVPLHDRLRLEGALGHYWLANADGTGYTHAQLTTAWAFRKPFELRLTLHGTDASAKRLFPGLAGSRVEAALQASF